MSHSVRVYLFRAEVTTFQHALHKERVGWESRPIKGADPTRVEFWVKPNHPSHPSMVERYGGMIDLSDINSNRFSSSVMLFLVNGRVIAECTGHGHALLLRHNLVEDFGSVLTSRFGDPLSFKMVESRVYGHLAGTNSVQRQRGASVESMVPNGVLYDVKRIAVFPNPRHAAGRIEEGGIGYLDRSKSSCIGDRINRLESYLEEYAGGSKLPASVILAKPVEIPRDSSVSEELYRDMLAEIAEGNNDQRVEFWIPQITDGHNESDCVFKIGSFQFEDGIVDWNSLRSFWVSRSDWSIQSILNTYISIFYRGEVIQRESLLRCLHMETSLHGDAYIHDEGRWIRVSPEYMDSIERRVQEFESTFDSVGLVRWEKGWEEDDYNKVVGCQDGWHCIHPVTWRREDMMSGVEIADLVDYSGRIVHVKRYDDSKQMAYLLNQVRNAASVLSMPTGARQFIDEQRKHISIPVYTGRSDCIVIAAGSRRYTRVTELRSAGVKIALAKALGDLTQLGYRAELVWIPME